MNKQKKAQAGTRTGCGMTARRRLRSSDGEDEIVHRDKHLCFLWRRPSPTRLQIRDLRRRYGPCCLCFRRHARPCRAAVPEICTSAVVASLCSWVWSTNGGVSDTAHHPPHWLVWHTVHCSSGLAATSLAVCTQYNGRCRAAARLRCTEWAS